MPPPFHPVPLWFMELVERFVAGDDDATLDNANVAVGDNNGLIQDVQPHGRLGGGDNFNYNNSSTIMDSNANITLNDTTTVNDDGGLDHSAIAGAAAQDNDEEEPGSRHCNEVDGRSGKEDNTGYSADEEDEYSNDDDDDDDDDYSDAAPPLPTPPTAAAASAEAVAVVAAPPPPLAAQRVRVFCPHCRYSPGKVLPTALGVMPNGQLDNQMAWPTGRVPWYAQRIRTHIFAEHVVAYNVTALPLMLKLRRLKYLKESRERYQREYPRLPLPVPMTMERRFRNNPTLSAMRDILLRYKFTEMQQRDIVYDMFLMAMYMKPLGRSKIPRPLRPEGLSYGDEQPQQVTAV